MEIEQARAEGKITDNMEQARITTIERHGEPTSYFYDGLCKVLFMEYSWITLGIETDGYVHS
jgi:hypothetical protein